MVKIHKELKISVRTRRRAVRFAVWAGLLLCALLSLSILKHPASTIVHAIAALLVFAGFAALGRHLFVSQRQQLLARRSHCRQRRRLARLEAEVETLNDLNWSLRESEEKYRGLIDIQAEIILRRDTEGRLTFVNDMFCETFDVRKADVLGKPSSLVVLNSPGQQFDPATATGEYEQQIMTKAGPRWFAWENFAVTDNKNHLVEIQSVARDITETKQIQRDMVEARDQAESASWAKSRFLATMSHEIRTPMNGILGMTKLLLKTKLESEQHTYAEALEQSGQALLTLINDILDFSKIEADKITLQSMPFNPVSLFQGITELMATRAEDKAIEMACYLAPCLPPRLIGDGPRLRQVVLNLCANAIKFTEHGGVCLSVTVENDAGQTTASKTRLSIAVQDTGIGMSSQDQEIIFEEFSQADPSPSRKHGGTGLGLAISQRLITAMGGAITVDSKPGRGAVFSFTLDFDQATLPAKASPPAPVSLTHHHLLLLSGSSVIQQSLGRLLTDMGAGLTLAASAEQAHALIEQAEKNKTPFSAVLSDYTLADQSPEDFATQVKARTTNHGDDSDHPPAPRLIILLPPGQRGNLKSLIQAGFDAYLIKPVRAASLIEQLSNTSPMTWQPGLDVVPPGKSEPKPAKPPPPHSGSVEPRTLRVLLVEDTPISALLARAVLEHEHYQVSHVENGAEALAAVIQTIENPAAHPAFDLILMDIRMPGMDGIAATRKIRAFAERGGNWRQLASLPIVALSANSFQEDRMACLQAGMNDFLPKPFDIEDLNRILAFWTSRAKPEHDDTEPTDPADPTDPTDPTDSTDPTGPGATALARGTG